MVYSMPSATADWVHRRMKASPASTIPRASASAPSSKSPARSPCSTGPSTTRRTTRGTARLAPVPAAAASSIQAMWCRYGRT